MAHRTQANTLKALIWDTPTRLFHWTLVVLFAIAWLTGEAEGAWFVVHRLAGYAIAIALVFRLIWGFAGSQHARFSDFLRGWSSIRDHLRGVLAFRPSRSLGHNPIGGWMIVVLLLALAAQLGTGLFASEDGVGGPLATLVSPATAHALAETHEALSGVVLGLVVLHVVGVLVESLLTRDNLIRAMVTGRKPVTPEQAEAERAAVVAPAWLAAATLGVATAIVWLIVAA